MYTVLKNVKIFKFVQLCWNQLMFGFVTALSACGVTLFVWNIQFGSCQSPTLESWTLSPAPIPADRNYDVAYSEDSYYSECIFLFGGNTQNKISCFNLTSTALEYWDDLDNSLENNGRTQPTALIISNQTDDILYYTSKTCKIVRYDLNRKQSTILNTDLSTEGWNGCPLVENPLKKGIQLLTINADNSNSKLFGAYNIQNNSIEYGQDLNVGVTRPFVVMLNDDYFNNGYPYFYVIGGQQNEIQRLNLMQSPNDVTSIDWETLTVFLPTSKIDEQCDVTDWDVIYASGGVQYDNIIYVIGGYNDASNKWCTLAFDFTQNSIEYVGNFPRRISRYGITYVIWIYCTVCI